MKISEWLQEEILKKFPNETAIEQMNASEIRGAIYELCWKTQNKTLERAAQKLEEERIPFDVTDRDISPFFAWDLSIIAACAKIRTWINIK